MRANELNYINDLKIQIQKKWEPTVLEEVIAYGPLNAKMLARTIRDDNFEHVRQNSDNWAAYAMAKYVEANVGVYPILPLADGHTWGDNAEEKPNALFLTKGDQTIVNQEIYNSDNMDDVSATKSVDGLVYEVAPFSFRSDSDYPKWYIDGLEKARSGDLDAVSTMKRGNSLSIAMVSTVNSHSGSADISSTWNFYTTTVGKAVGSCGETDGEKITPGEGSSDVRLSGDLENPPWPGGSFKLKIGGEDCEYKNDGTNPGRLFCPKKQIVCREDHMKSKKEGSVRCGARGYFHPVAYCDF